MSAVGIECDIINPVQVIDYMQTKVAKIMYTANFNKIALYRVFQKKTIPKRHKNKRRKSVLVCWCVVTYHLIPS